MSETNDHHTLLAADIVAAYVTNHHVPPAELPGLLRTVHGAIAGLHGVAPAAAALVPAEQPSASEIRKSIRPDGLVSFIDGQARKTLKRHLTNHGLTPASYRARYGLPTDYPMTSAAYSEARSALAKAIGLGQPGAMAKRQAAE